MTLKQMVFKVFKVYLSVNFMLFFINLPFNGILADGSKLWLTVLGTVTLIIFIILSIAYMSGEGRKASSRVKIDTFDAGDAWLGAKAAAVAMIPLFAYSVFLMFVGSGAVLSLQTYEGLKFPTLVLFGPFTGYIRLLFNRTWLYPVFMPLAITAIFGVSYYMGIRDVRLPKFMVR